MKDIFLQLYGGTIRLGFTSQSLESAFSPPAKSRDKSEVEIQKYGQALYGASLASLPEKPSPGDFTRIFVEDSDEHDWELLHDGENFLALKQNTILRYSKNKPQKTFSLSHAPLRLLYSRVNQSSEEEEILKNLAAQSAGQIEVTILRNPSRLRLSQVLDEAQANQKPIHLWHYSGEISQNSLVLADNSSLNRQQIEKLLQNYPDLRGMVLNLPNQSIGGTGFAELPLAYLLAPKAALSSEVSRSFLESWYQRLLQDGLAQALLKARQKSYQFAFGENSDWASYVLYAASREDTLFQTIGKAEAIGNFLRDQVFISYSHQDDPWCEQLMAYLEPLRQSAVINAWVDKDIEAGSDWYKDIQNALARAKVAVLLASPAFFRSSFIQKEELPPILAAREAGQCTVIWVALSAYAYELSKLNSIQAVHPPNQPLDRLEKSQVEDVLLQIARLVAAALKES